MQVLLEKFYKRMQSMDVNFIRLEMYEINWSARLIGVKGARGVGKTTLLLQYIKKNLPINHETLYVSLDNIWFAKQSLSDLVYNFVNQGGKYLFLDEVHKYPNWAQELKNFYDDYPQLKIVFTGSSMLEILNARADLSRRALIYNLKGLSFRSFLNLTQQTNFKHYTLNEILNNHTEISNVITQEIKPLQHFKNYLQYGYYPFFIEGKDIYFQRLEEVLNLIIEIELPLLRKLDIAFIYKIKKLLQIISESVPFTPNVAKLSERIEINRNTLVNYLYYLQEANITINLYKDAKGITQLQKPNKIYLENTNLLYTLSPQNTNVGNLRETFFINQLQTKHLVEYADKGDFYVDRKFTFEIGGLTKNNKQIVHIENSFVAKDDIEFGQQNTIPLWLFGFLY